MAIPTPATAGDADMRSPTAGTLRSSVNARAGATTGRKCKVGIGGCLRVVALF